MATLVSDNLEIKDCIRCRCSQKQFGDLCAHCYFTETSNEKLRKILAEENDFVIRFLARLLAWACVALLCGIVIFLVALWK